MPHPRPLGHGAVAVCLRERGIASHSWKFSLCGIIKVGLFGNKARLQPRPKQRGKQLVVFTSELENQAGNCSGFFLSILFSVACLCTLGTASCVQDKQLNGLDGVSVGLRWCSTNGRGARYVEC
jgi:hypothetical protein